MAPLIHEQEGLCAHQQGPPVYAMKAARLAKAIFQGLDDAKLTSLLSFVKALSVQALMNC